MPAREALTFRFLAAPGDAGSDGVTVQAGSVLEWIDRAGYACAVGWAGTSCVTVYAGNVQYSRPIAVGELIEAQARLIHTGTTSLHVIVSVFSADVRTDAFTLAARCLLIFVAVDQDGAPTEVAPWEPRTIEDLDYSESARRRIGERARIKEEMSRQRYTDEGTAPRITLRFLASPAVVNFGGNVHGGSLMRWIDEAARATGAGWTHRDPVAVYSGGIHFTRPVHIGDLVEVDARLIHTGPRSMHIAVRVSSGDPRTADRVFTTQCMTILVITGEDGRAEPIEPFIPRSDEDMRLDAHAQLLVRMRKDLDPLPDATYLARH